MGMALQDILERKEILLKPNDMTNEEKARAIIGEDCKKENCLQCGGRYSAEKGGCAEYQKIMQIAKWKDEQFSKFLLWLDDYFVIKRFTDGEPMTYAELIDNFESNSYERNTKKTD